MKDENIKKIEEMNSEMDEVNITEFGCWYEADALNESDDDDDDD